MSNMRKWLPLLSLLVLAALLAAPCAAGASSADLTLRLPGTITVQGTPPQPAETYVVHLKADDASFPMPAGAVDGESTIEVQGTDWSQAGATADPIPFELPEITYRRVGVYTYTVWQTCEGTTASTLDATVYTLKVTIHREPKADGTGDELLLDFALRVKDEDDKKDSIDFVNVYPVATADLIVTKVWDDNDDQDGYRPRQLKVTCTPSDADIRIINITLLRSSCVTFSRGEDGAWTPSDFL